MFKITIAAKTMHVADGKPAKVEGALTSRQVGPYVVPASDVVFAQTSVSCAVANFTHSWEVESFQQNEGMLKFVDPETEETVLLQVGNGVFYTVSIEQTDAVEAGEEEEEEETEDEEEEEVPLTAKQRRAAAAAAAAEKEAKAKAAAKKRKAAVVEEEEEAEDDDVFGDDLEEEEEEVAEPRGKRTKPIAATLKPKPKAKAGKRAAVVEEEEEEDDFDPDADDDSDDLDDDADLDDDDIDIED